MVFFAGAASRAAWAIKIKKLLSAGPKVAFGLGHVVYPGNGPAGASPETFPTPIAIVKINSIVHIIVNINAIKLAFQFARRASHALRWI